MTEPDLPVPIGTPERRQRAEGGLRPLRDALHALEAQARALAEDGDLDSLGYGYHQLKLFSSDLRFLLGEVEQLIIGIAPTEERKGRDYFVPFTIEGVANFEVKRRAASTKYDSEALLEHIVTRAVVGNTGELPSAEAREVVERVVADLKAAVPFTGSLGWRVTALRDMGIDPDEFRETTRKEGHSLKVTGGKDE